jgi:hypothetical protein
MKHSARQLSFLGDGINLTHASGSSSRPAWRTAIRCQSPTKHRALDPLIRPLSEIGIGHCLTGKG